MLRINWVNYERNPYCGFWEIQFQRKNVSYFRSTIGRGRGSWIAYFFGSNHSLIVIVCNCDESFCVWLTEIIHSSNFLKSAICVRDFQGIVRDYLKEFWLFDPWWIPKLRNQPAFGLNPKIPSVSCPLDRFVPCGVEQTNNSYAVSSASLNFQQQGQNPIRFIGGVHWLDACVFSRMRILENKGT